MASLIGQHEYSSKFAHFDSRWRYDKGTNKLLLIYKDVQEYGYAPPWENSCVCLFCWSLVCLQLIVSALQHLILNDSAVTFFWDVFPHCFFVCCSNLMSKEMDEDWYGGGASKELLRGKNLTMFLFWMKFCFVRDQLQELWGLLPDRIATITPTIGGFWSVISIR